MINKIILFTSDTCPSCPAAKKTLASVRKTLDDKKIEVLELNAFKEGIDLATRFGVCSLPTLLFFKEGMVESARMVGFITPARILQAVE